METIILKLSNGNTDAACKAAGICMKEGGIVGFPTDTVYGLGAVYNDAEAVRKIFKAKGRPENKPISILISDASQVDLLAADVPEEAKRLMARFWPGALTLIFNKKEGIPEEVTAGGSTIGIRMPASEAARKIIQAAGAPVAAPSANRSGERSSVTADDVREDLDGKIDMIIDGGACPVGISSTVLDISKKPFKIIREGTVTAEMIAEAIGE